MAIDLSKGQRINLSKDGGGSLSRVAVGLGWGKKKGGLFGGKKSVDLDASCILYDQSKIFVDSVWFQQLRSKDGSIIHAGDDLVGGGSENDPNEVINVDLRSVPSGVQSIVFVVNSYSGVTFKGVPFAFVNVVDMSSNEEVARYNLQTAGGDYKGFIIAKVYRHNEGWKFQAIGEQCTGRQQTIADIEPFAKNFA